MSVQNNPSREVSAPASNPAAALFDQLGAIFQQPEAAFGMAYNTVKSMVGPIFDNLANQYAGKFKGTKVEKAAAFTATVVASAVIAKIVLEKAGTKLPETSVAKHFENHLAQQVHQAALNIDEAINVTAVRNPLLNLNSLTVPSKENV